MLIIIEGVDGTGKSTLAEQLLEELGDATLIHRGPPEAHPLIEYEQYLDDYDPRAGRHIICDRWHWGERIYGPLYRGKSDLDDAMFTHVEMYLRSRGALLVHLVHGNATLARRLHEKGEDFLKPEDLRHVSTAYHRIERETLLPVMKFTDPWSSDRHRIERRAYQLQEEASALAPFPTYVGPPSPGLLLLGERRGSEEYRAAFVPQPATSGHFMLEHMPAVINSTIGLGIANALEENIPELVKTLGNPSIVTLGRLAHECAKNYGVVHGAVPHPQFIRRFHHAAGAAYCWTIIRAGHTQEDLRTWRP